MKVKDCTLIEPFMCKEDENIIEVAKKLREITLRHIFVVDNEEKPKGIISVLDMNNRVVAENKDLSAIAAKDVMSKPIDVFDENEDVKQVYERMIEQQHAMDAVVRDGKMIGIVTLNQIMNKCRECDKNE